jgi:hypothetical protein
MRRLLASIMVVAAAVVVAAGGARGDESLHANVTASAGWTDNILNAPEGGGPNDPEIESGTTSQLRPGLTFSQETRRFIHVASYIFSANLFVEHPEANSYSNRIAWQGIYAMSPVSELSFSASGANGRINSFNTTLDAGASELEQLPDGGVDYVSTSVSEAYRRDLSRAWRLSQSLSYRLYKPIDDASSMGTNYALAGGLGGERRYKYDSLGLVWRTDYIVNGGGVADDGMATPRDRQLVIGPQVRWLHDFGSRISGDISAGTLVVLRADDFRRGIVQPSGSLGLRYTRERGRVELMYQHTVAPNIFVGQTSANDRVMLRGGLPLPWIEQASIGGSIGYQRGRSLNLEDQVLEGTSQVFLADAAIAWRVSTALSLSLRYQQAQQLRDMAAPGTLVEYRRAQVLLSLSGRYPGRQAATIPFRGGGRVDESDEGSFGETDSQSGGGVGDRR